MTRWRSIVAGVVCLASVVCGAAAALTGKWQGATASGRPIVLDAKVSGDRLTGTLTVADQTGNIAEGKADEKTFSFKVAIEGRTVSCSGRLIAEGIELTVEDVPDRLILKRAK